MISQEAVTMLENELKETQQKGEDIARDYDNKIWVRDRL